jgi:HlyD family secretion protein
MKVYHAILPYCYTEMTKAMKKRTTISLLVLVAIIVLITYFSTRNSSGKYQFVTVNRGTITEAVTVTGNTTPVESLDLSFESAGTIATVRKNAGDHVVPGEVLVQLDTRDLQAQLAQAQATVDSAQATLDKLKAGPTPQNIQVSQAALTSAKQSLTNTYTGITDTLTAALAKATDAIRNQLAPLYSNPEATNAQLTFTVSDSQIFNNANNQRVQASGELNTWQNEITSITANTSPDALSQSLKSASTHLSSLGAFLNTVSMALVNASGLSSASSSAYKTDVVNAVTDINTASTAITTATQNIASQKSSVAEAQAKLDDTLAGSTQQDIAAQQAQVAQAQANMQGTQVKIAKASLVSPITGVVTVQNAKTGQIATPNQVLTSLISDANLEVDANVPETDIGKVSVANPVTLTFDAFPGETFTGKVFYIDPAQTIVSGVVDYKIKVSLDKADPRVKSGLTANLTIQTKTDMSALILPQFAILQNTSGTFVEVLQNGSPTEIPVTLGIHDQQGNVEVASGVTEGQQVINIGLKTQ